MSRKGHRGVIMEGLVMPTKTRKRGCSSSSSSSSRIYSYRLNKRAILVGKNRGGAGSRSSTPVPRWRTTGGIESPKHSQGGKSARPVTARMLAATLWEMNGMPSPKMSESNLEVMKRQQQKRGGSRMAVKGDKMQPGLGLHLASGSGSLPRHLSDPPHSPTVSEKMDRSGMGSHRRRTPSISQMLMSVDHNVGVVDSISNASFMEIETRSRPPTSSGSVAGSRSRLKDVSSAITTSKELLKIINRMWARADRPSSSLSLISALHTELERARLHVNHLIQEQRSEKTEINHLLKCFAEERASWQAKQQQAVESALRPVASELEAERKLRRRLEGLNGKLGKELTEAKSSLFKVVKELEREKRAREMLEQAIDEVEKEREMLEVADKLREERVQMKLSEAKHQFEEKNSAVTKLRKHLEAFLGTKRDKNETVLGSVSEGESGESEIHLIELDLERDKNVDKEYKRDFTSNFGRRSVSDGVDWTNQSTGKSQLLPSSRLGMVRENHSPLRDKERSRPSRDSLLERSSLSKSRTAEGQANRRPKR